MLRYKQLQRHSMCMIRATECILLYAATKIAQDNVTWAKMLYVCSQTIGFTCQLTGK